MPDQQGASSSSSHATPAADVPSNGTLPSPFHRAAQTAPVLAGRFEYTIVVRNRPRTLDAWRVTTTSAGIAERIAQLLGGRVQQDTTSGLAEILTTAPTVDILLAGPTALRVHWQHADHPCDGATQGDGRPCACSPGLAQRRAAAKQGRGCQPDAELRFRLTGYPRLGTFSFACEDWSFIELVASTQATLRGRQLGDSVRARLGLQRGLHPLRSGLILPYTRPVITLLGDQCPASLVSEVETGST